MTTKTKSTTESSKTAPRRLQYARIVQNFHLVWLDGSIDENNDDFGNSIVKLRVVVNMVTTFMDVGKCIDFIKEVGEKAFVIISGEFSEDIIAMVQAISQVHSIYIYCKTNMLYEKWSEESPKVVGTYTDITFICEAIKEATRNNDRNSVSISYVKETDGTVNKNLDTLDQSFMYTQILKEILLTIDFEPVHFNEFITYCRKEFVDSTIVIPKIQKLEKEYARDQAIRCYTESSFLYTLLNRALRTMEADLIANMGFFVRDLHDQIARLHSEQYVSLNHSNSFTVYRGQSLSKIDFDQLKSIQGGLLSFNNFLSTSLEREVSLDYAKSNRNNPDLIGVLFKMNIDLSITSTPFANIQEFSCFEEENEILFSMHSIFRVGEVKQIEENDHLWQVDLSLTSDNDSQLEALTEIMRTETLGLTGWFRLGRLMMKVAQYDKAEQLFRMILDRPSDILSKSLIFHYLGWIKDDQGNNTKAITYYKKSLEIKQKLVPANDPSLATSYNNIGLVYNNMGEYAKALSYYEKALEIQQQSLAADHPDLATSFNNIGSVYDNMGEHSKALSYLEKALEIQQKTLPGNHPSFAIAYNEIGLVYDSMGEYPKALSYHEKALGIKQISLPTNHPSLATSYNNIGRIYDSMGEYPKAISSYEKALEIQQKSFPANHPDLATSYSNIGLVYDSMGEYPKARSYHEKALEIKQISLPTNHPDLATSYNNIGLTYHRMDKYSEAISYYEKALTIFEKTLPSNHPDLATSCNNIGSVYGSMGEYSKARSYHEKALGIWQKTLPVYHPDLATSYNNVGVMHLHMGEHSKALSYYEKALGILQKTLPANHSDLARCYINIGLVYQSMSEYSKALSYYEKALEIYKKTLPSNHPDLATSYSSIGMVYDKMGQYSKALPYLERAFDIAQSSLPSNPLQLIVFKWMIEMVKMKCM